MVSKNQHVIPHQGKWAVKREGSSRVTSVHDSKQEAIDAARKIARNQSGRLYVHGRNGQILLGAEASSSIRDDKIRAVVRGGLDQARAAAKKSVKKSQAAS
jgi:hypothetical protein